MNLGVEMMELHWAHAYFSKASNMGRTVPRAHSVAKTRKKKCLPHIQDFCEQDIQISANKIVQPCARKGNKLESQAPINDTSTVQK